MSSSSEDILKNQGIEGVVNDSMSTAIYDDEVNVIAIFHWIIISLLILVL